MNSTSVSAITNNIKIYLLTLITFMVGTTQFGIVGMLDQIASSVGVSVSTAGQLVTAFALGNAIGTPLVIMAANKLSQRKQLMLALALVLAGTVMLVVIPSYFFMMLSRIVMGIGTGVYIVTAYGVAAKLATPGHQGRAMSSVSMGASSSLVFGVPLGRMIGSAYGWKSIFIIAGILSMLALYGIYREIPDMECESSISLSQRLKVLKNPRIAIALIGTFFIFIGFSMIDTYITPYLAAVLPSMQSKISYILMALGFGSLMGSKLGGYFSDKLGISLTITVASIIQICTLVLLHASSGIAILTILLLIIWECACWMFGPTQNFNLVSLAPDISGVALSLNSTFVQFGFATGALLGGVAVSRWSILEITGISAVSVVIALTIFTVADICFRKHSRMLNQKDRTGTLIKFVK